MIVKHENRKNVSKQAENVTILIRPFTARPGSRYDLRDASSVRATFSCRTLR